MVLRKTIIVFMSRPSPQGDSETPYSHTNFTEHTAMTVGWNLNQKSNLRPRLSDSSLAKVSQVNMIKTNAAAHY